MLSKKMAVSLTSLITILALAFVVTPAMAGEFGVALDTTNDFSAADGYQLEHPGDGMKITLNVEFDKAVVLAKESVQIITLDKMGKLLSLQKFPAAAETAADAGRMKSFEPEVEEKATTVKLLIAAGVASADPFNTDTSKKLEATIGLVGADDGPPTVNSIERVGINFRQIKTPKISPTANSTVQVRITLSEMPKAFDKDHINVTEAAVTSVVQLVPEGGTSLADFAASDDAPDNFPRTRGIYDEEILPGVADADDPNDVYTAGTATLASTLQALVDAESSTVRNAKLEARVKYGGIHRAINEAKTLTGTAYKYKMVPLFGDSTPTNATALSALDPDKTDVEFGIAASADATIDTLATADGETGTANLITTPSKPSKTESKPAIPNVTDFATGELYDLALAKYAADFDVYAANANMWARYNAYTSAKMKEEMMDQDAQMEAYEMLAASVRAAASVPTGRDAMVYPYLVTLTPKYANTNDVVVKVKEFEDLTSPVSERYIPPRLESGYTEGLDKLTIMVSAAKTPDALGAGTSLSLPHGEGAMIPANGFYLLTKNKDGSGINWSHEKDAENLSHKQTPAQLLFNVRAAGLPNLETFFLNGGTIHLVAYDGTAAGSAYISEVMWGSDASQDDSSNSQWIEIANTTASAISVGENKWKLWFYQANETPATSYTDGTLLDTIGTERSDTGVFWSVAGIGRSGRTNVDPGGADVAAIAPRQSLISMVRATDASGAPLNGTLPSSWAASGGPSVNFKLGIEGTRVATPGAEDVNRPMAPTPKTPAPTTPVAKAKEIMITEIMVDTANGRLPQWIELTSSAIGEVSLDGWEMTIDNAIDAEVVGKGNALTVSLGGVTLDVSAHDGNTGKGQSVLVVAWTAPSVRASKNIREDRVIVLAGQLNQTSRYQLLSYDGFRITLVPPDQGAISAFGDIAGNLDEEWELPMSEGSARSSLIRREMLTDGMGTMGTDANGWILADSTTLTIGQESYYGDDEDAGTPGQDAGGPLPVELSHFRPARDKATGAVVITWATQSELNNAGFFIKRSQQRNGEFKVINATMIAGAGTTSEKQFYTYTDTTAQPNVVYYYQIEDVSLDGNRQTLTQGIRLKGHVGAAGKATTTWGELKASHE